MPLRDQPVHGHVPDPASSASARWRSRTPGAGRRQRRQRRRRGDFVQSLDALRAAGPAAWAGAHPGELDAHGETVEPESMFTIIYTSGTTGNPKGVVLTHENLTAGVCSAIRAMQHRRRRRAVPVPAAGARAGARARVGAIADRLRDRVLARAPRRSRRTWSSVRPTFMAGVPRIFEKFYAGVQTALAQGSPAQEEADRGWALRVGKRELRRAARRQAPGRRLAFQHALADKLVFSKLRARLGLDRCRFLVSGGAPLAAEIAEFFHATGLLILRGLRADRDHGGGVPEHAGQVPLRHRRARRWTSSRSRSPPTARS